ncbi:SDR family NAD(P)-dependent oxidoreductase [Pararobbsia silviterrae]|uniref:SDR family oxidoreductase n=1 Tax=Pararobbsia silviterrae TaxID=1792498 RepID=A0A494XU77_9BURK|nr:SDR family oxidoreductase [Pararobbsia silviterrae]RKP53392.1 SDR family oxidoreductase [Pararobbsia silviterrae]
MSHSHDNGTALVTGASTGIGATYADRLARRGYDLILVARNAQRLDALAARLRSETGRSVQTLVADLRKPDDLAKVEQTLRSDARITLLVNNAGTATLGPLGTADIERLNGEIDLNIVAPTRLSHAVLPGLVSRGRGTIVNIASVLSQMIQPGNGVYGGTKAYLLHLSQVLNEEVGAAGVHVQAVLPGATRTEIWETSGADINEFPASMIMEVDEMVDAALAGLDAGETVTIPSLPDPADWQRFLDARAALRPNLSHQHPAPRYGVAAKV